MSMNEKEELRQKIQLVVQKMSRGDIQNLIAYFFETAKIPQVIAMTRGNSHVEGFAKLSRRIFKFEIIFFENNNKTVLWIKLKHNKSIIEKRENIEIKEVEEGINIYLAEPKQYLFSVYF